jgi:hypothetical protein
VEVIGTTGLENRGGMAEGEGREMGGPEEGGSRAVIAVGGEMVLLLLWEFVVC